MSAPTEDGDVRHRWIPSPHGPFLMTQRNGRLVATGWKRLGSAPPLGAQEDRALRDELAHRISLALEGSFQDFTDLSLPPATEFRRACWQQARRVPGGCTQSYHQLAKAMGKPGASRAVGQAMRNNPLPIIVPCHRIVGANGRLGGFSGSDRAETVGMVIKKELIGWEDVQRKKNASDQAGMAVKRYQ